MIDRELLELAAKAAGVELEWDGPPDIWQPMYYQGKTYHGWNPLTDDGDAFRLMVDLRLIVVQYTAGLTVHQGGPVLANTFYANFDGDRRATTRHAIVRAAAEIGRSMK